MSAKIGDNNFIQTLNKKPNFHNIDMPVWDFSSHLERMSCFNICDQNKAPNPNDALIHRIQFLNLINELSSQKGKILRNCCKLPELHLNLQQFVLAKLEDKVEQYLTNNPFDEVFREKWKLLRVASARLLYQIDTTAKSKLEESFKFVQEQLMQIEQEIPKKLRVQEETIWKIFFEILSKDIHLVEVPIALLTGISSCNAEGDYILKTYSEALLETNNFLVKRLQRNLPWVLHYCETKLQPFSEHSNKRIQKLSSNLLQKLNECRKLILPNLPKLMIKAFAVSPNYSQLLNQLKDFKDHVLFGVNGLPNFMYAPREEVNTRLKAHDFFEVAWETCKFSDSFIVVKTTTKHLENCLDALLKQRNASPINKGKDLTDIDEKIQMINDLKTFREAVRECSELMSVYFKYPYATLVEVGNAFNTWITSPGIQKEIKVSVDDLTDYVNGKNSSQPKRKKIQNPRRVYQISARKDEPFQAAPLESPKNEEKPLVKVATSFVEPESQEGLKELKHISQVLAGLVGESSPQEKAAYRQAHMSLEDLIEAIQGLEQAQDDSVKLLYYNMIIQFAYLYLEQILQCQILKSTYFENAPTPKQHEGHNLRALLKKIKGVVIPLQIKKIVNELFVGYLWTRSTFEQIEKRDELGLEIPQCLRLIRQLYESNVFSNKKVTSQVSKVLPFCKQIGTFTMQLPITSDWKKNLKVYELETGLFKHQGEIDTTKYRELIMTCKELLKHIPPFLQPTFKQAICHMELVTGCLIELNKKEISSRALSFLVRSLIFWENSVLEELLRTLYGLKTGIFSISHKVNKLYLRSMPSPQAKSKEELDFLIKKMANVHNITRYPFSTTKGSTFMRDLILKAERLREFSDLGFELKGNTTPLNYLPLKEGLLKPQDIILELVNTSNEISCLIKGKIIPEIQRHVYTRPA